MRLFCPYIPHEFWQTLVTRLEHAYACRFGFYVRLGAPLPKLMQAVLFSHFSRN